MATHNPNCDGGHCRREAGEVRVYPLGAGGNLILCAACWAHENAYRVLRGRETGAPENWPPVDWSASEVYGGAPVPAHAGHKADCISGNRGPEWSGSPNYAGNPDTEWLCDECGGVIAP